MIDPRSALVRWETGLPASVERMGGTNNLSWRVETAGDAYILRIYQNEGKLAHVSYEHMLLAHLDRMRLSFRVPVPILSRTGRTLEPIATEKGSTMHASLFAVIPGRHPLTGSLEEAAAAGRALGELDAALAELSLDPGEPVISLHHQLEGIHPLVPAPLDAIRQIEADEGLRERFAMMIEHAQDGAARLYASLPVQIIHNDIARSNTLIEHGRVSGIVDFEFTGPDLRVFDPAVGVLMFGADWSDGSFHFDLPLVRAFTAGYREVVRLTPPEIAAIPDVLRLRSAVSVIHRLGRSRAGLAALDDVRSRMREGLRLDAWLREHGKQLVDAAGSE